MTDRLHICLVSQRFPTAGFLWAVAQGLTARGHKVSVITQRNLSSLLAFKLENATIHGLGDVRLSAEEFARRALDKFDAVHRADPVHLVHSIDRGGVSIGLARKRYGIAVIYDVNATHLGQLYSILGTAQETSASFLKVGFSVLWNFLKSFYGHDRGLLKTADAVFVHSPQQRVALERYYLYPDSRIFTVPFGLRVDDLSPRQKSGELMKKLGLPANAQVVVTVNDMTDIAEMRYLLRAFEKVAVKKPAARLIVIGTGVLKKEIEYEMLTLALGGRTHFVGDLSGTSLSEHIALADVFVNLSARSSDVDQSLLEAMAQGKVIIGSEVSPLGTVVEDGVDGFLIRPADTITLAELMLQIFNSQIEVSQIGEKAREKILNLFDSTKMMEITLQAYVQSLRRSRCSKASRVNIDPATVRTV